MAIICRFEGITVKMEEPTGNSPKFPHVIAQYKNYKCMVNLEGDTFNGKFPFGKKIALEGWVSVRENEIRDNWKRMKKGLPLKQIRPWDVPTLVRVPEDQEKINERYKDCVI